jgi:hypothetical protein
MKRVAILALALALGGCADEAKPPEPTDPVVAAIARLVDCDPDGWEKDPYSTFDATWWRHAASGTEVMLSTYGSERWTSVDKRILDDEPGARLRLVFTELRARRIRAVADKACVANYPELQPPCVLWPELCDGTAVLK